MHLDSIAWLISLSAYPTSQQSAMGRHLNFNHYKYNTHHINPSPSSPSFSSFACCPRSKSPSSLHCQSGDGWLEMATQTDCP